MAEPVISIENISKSYQLGVIGTGTFRGDVQRWWAKLRGKPDPFLKVGQEDHRKRNGETVWALKNINLTVKQGEAVGIIGRNGAGKSTLLKILSQVTAPTSGEVKVRGRIASLLEVGTGFHGELTGRENIFLNGAILGMSRREIERKLDEIVDFSGVESYIDTPVKRYSSGMYVRLAFAVAAHLDPDILVVDEVLAVGDAAFQKKCLGKMENASQKEGRTVLFVSHNMGMVTSLCHRAILLNAGKIMLDGPVSAAVSGYYSDGVSSPYSVDFSKQNKKIGDEFATLLEAHIEDMEGNHTGEVKINEPFRVKMIYALHASVPVPPYPNFHFKNSQGQYVFVTPGGRSHSGDGGVYEATCVIPANLLNNDVYYVGLALTFTHSGDHVSFYERESLSVVVRDPIDETLDNLRSGYSGSIPGVVRPKLEWQVRKIS